MWDAYREMSLDYGAGCAPQECYSPAELGAQREQLLAYAQLNIDTYAIGCPISGDARVHYDMAVLRGFVEDPE